jgi:hypothetical protein
VQTIVLCKLAKFPMPKMKPYHSFAEWKKDQSEKNQKLITSLERLIKKHSSHLVQSVKWGQGCFLNDDKPIMYIHAESEYIQLGFYNGSALVDPAGVLEGKGKYIRFVIIKSNKDVQKDILSALIHQVV